MPKNNLSKISILEEEPYKVLLGIGLAILKIEKLSEIELMKTFETHDLYLASALKIHGFKIIDVKRNGNGRGVFIFEDRPDRVEFVRDYFNGELQGSLKSFSNAWSDLKSLINEL